MEESAGKEVQAEDARQLAELRARDREVRTHEQAHQAAGGQYTTGGVQYSYQRGPDGRYYAVGGEVGISSSAVAGDPQATLRKMEVVRRAALAPAEPSAQDLKVAAQATATANQARAELAEEQAQAGDAEGAAGRDEPHGVAAALQAYAEAEQHHSRANQALDLFA